MKKIIKSPMNYIGGKHKILNQLLDLFPKNISMFYDVFGGGGSVSLNVESKYVYYNDIVPYVSELFETVKGEDSEILIEKIKYVIKEYDLNKTNKEGFETLRKFYNEGNKEWYIFYTLMCFSFNNQYRFNNKHEYNSSFGYHKSCFTKHTEEKFKLFSDRLNNIDIIFSSLDFREIDFSSADENDFVYLDPPYLITCGNYNDGKRGFKGWSKQDDLDLMNLCDKLNNQGVKFGMSNVIEHKGLLNQELIDWCKKNNYLMIYINNNYNNCNYQNNNKRFKTQEVYICNY